MLMKLYLVNFLIFKNINGSKYKKIVASSQLLKKNLKTRLSTEKLFNVPNNK